MVLAGTAGATEATPRDCGRCHVRHYDEWSQSAHGQSTTSALYRWQELFYRAALEQQGLKDAGFCASCHAPSSHGVSCLTCHEGEGAVMLGPLEDPRDAIVHKSKKSPAHENEQVCQRCHDHDLGSAVPCCTVVREWKEAEVREYMTCQSCHMRGVKNQPVAKGGPERTLHRHNFPAVRDLDQARGGWDLAFGRVGGGQVEVLVTNRAGHSLPNGEPFGTRVTLRIEARDRVGNLVGAAEQSFGFEMLDESGQPTVFVHDARQRGRENVLAAGEERKISMQLSDAPSYTAILGYSPFDPPDGARARIKELRQWIGENHPDWALELVRLEGQVAALARAVEIRRVHWTKEK